MFKSGYQEVIIQSKCVNWKQSGNGSGEFKSCLDFYVSLVTL